MAGRIPDDTLQLIRERVSIVEVVSGHVSLKRAGRNHLGLCPFHPEKTPSFTVSDERGLFHCFGCGVGGSVFTFLMKIENIAFREAAERLARRAGVELPKDAARDGGGERRNELIDLNEAAQRYFREAFRSPAGAPARQYTAKRGLGSEIIERYGVGFCPPSGGGLARVLSGQRRSIQKGIDIGLVGRRSDGSVYDRFRGRVTFPIRDGGGTVLGFGGRTLGDDQPKYLNSPESALFRKGNMLYGLFEARQAIRDAGIVVLVEGYLDALALVEAGIEHVVASLGTALTASQLRLARRFAPQIVAFFDGDRAGQQAAERAFTVCAEAGVWGSGAFLPEGFDPDSFVRQHGAEATTTLLRAAVPLADFFLRRVDPGPDASLPQREAAAKRVGEVLARVSDPMQFSLLASQAADHLGVDEAVLRTMRGAVGAPKHTPAAAAPINTTPTFRPEEVTLVEAMALDRDAAQLASETGVLSAFRSPELAEAGRFLLAAWERGQEGAEIVDQLPPIVATRVSAALLGEGPTKPGAGAQVAHDCIERIRRRALRLQTRAVRVRLKEAESSGDDTKLREELERARELLRRKAEGHV